MSEAELLAIMENDAAAEPADPTGQLTPEAVQRITVQYLEEAPVRLAEIRSALAQSDCITLARAAHSLKSTSRYVHATSLSALGAEMEQRADAGQLHEIPALIGLADREFAILFNHLQPPTSPLST